MFGDFDFSVGHVPERDAVLGGPRPERVDVLMHRDAAMAERVAGQRDHQDIGFAVAERAGALRGPIAASCAP
jgi:hypothetical protein